MREWRYPFGRSPETVFVLLDGFKDVRSWMDSVLPALNWRSHIFVVGGAVGKAETVTCDLLEKAGAHLERFGFANLHFHSQVALSSEESQTDVWEQLTRPLVPFQQQAQELMTEARLHFAPILIPGSDRTQALTRRAAEFFRSRLAIPSIYLPCCTHDGFVADGDARFYVDAEGSGLPALLWQNHVFETVLERIEHGEETLLAPCRSHLVFDSAANEIFSCFENWKKSTRGAEPPGLPDPPSGGSCRRCVAEAALSMFSNLRANGREAEGRRVCFKLSLAIAAAGDLTAAAGLALAAFELSQSDDDRVAALIQRAICLRESGELELAENALAEAAGYANDPGQIAYQRGRVQFVWRDYIEALEWFEQALESGSSHIPVEDMCFEMALCHVNLEEYREARPYLDRAEKPGRPIAPVAFYRGVCDVGESKIRAALDNFDTALALSPAPEDLGRVLYYKGLCYKELERYESAVSALKEAVAADPDDLANHNLLGFCLYKLKRHEEAVACFLRAVEIDPRSGIDWANLASNLRDLGRTEEAILMYKQALSLDPTIGFARDNLKRLTG